MVQSNSETPVHIPAVILAGGEADPLMQSRFGIQYRAELPIDGIPMHERVYNALSAAQYIKKIRIVGKVKPNPDVESIPPADSLLDNLIMGIKTSAPDSQDGKVLVSSSDIPFVTPEAIDDFISKCMKFEADLYYSYVLKSDCERKYPGVRRTYVKLAEGTVTGGNVFIMDAAFVEKNESLLREIMASRKNVIKMAGLIGISTLLRLIAAQILFPKALSIPYLENKAGRIVNAKLKAVRSQFPEIGTDIDNINQLDELVQLRVAKGELK